MLGRLSFFLGMAALPSILLLSYFYRRDYRKPEPKKVVTKVFIFGCIMTVPAIIVEQLISLPMAYVPLNWQAFYQAFAVAALVEEGLKFLLLKRLSRRMASFDEITDGIIYTMAAGLGFAFLENVLYGMSMGGGVGILILRGVTAVPLHCICSGIMGYYIGRAWQNPSRTGLIGLILAILVHGLYDWFLFSSRISGWWILAILPLAGFYLFKLIKHSLKLDQELGLS